MNFSVNQSYIETQVFTGCLANCPEKNKADRHLQHFNKSKKKYIAENIIYPFQGHKNVFMLEK